MYNRYFADISSNNPHFNARQYADAGHVAVAIKASEGINFIDPDHRTWVNAAHSEHLAVIHYHFARPDLGNHPADEAEHFLSVVRPSMSGRDFIVLDMERGAPRNVPSEPEWTAAFDQYVVDHFWSQLILYASRSNYMTSDRWLVNRGKGIWDADWSEGPSVAPVGYHTAFRQYTDGLQGPEPHVFGGIGPCDGNRIDPHLFAQIIAKAKPRC